MADEKQDLLGAYEEWDSLSTRLLKSNKPNGRNKDTEYDENEIMVDDWDGIATMNLKEKTPKFSFFTEVEAKEEANKRFEEARKKDTTRSTSLGDFLPKRVFDDWIVFYMHDIPVKVVDVGYFPVVVINLGRVAQGQVFVKLGSCQTISSKHANILFNPERRCFELQVTSGRGVTLNSSQDVFPTSGVVPLPKGESTLTALCDPRLLERNGKTCAGHTEVRVVIGAGKVPESVRPFQHIQSNLVHDMRGMGFSSDDRKRVMGQMERGTPDGERKAICKARVIGRAGSAKMSSAGYLEEGGGGGGGPVQGSADGLTTRNRGGEVKTEWI